MLKIDPEPGELMSAHEARRRRILGHSPREFLNGLRRDLGLKPEVCDLIPRLHLLAMTTSMDAEAYAARHSMLPLHRVVTFKASNDAHGSDRAAVYSKLYGMKPHRKGAYVCIQCVEACLASGEVPCYRREHHCVGIDWCWKHGTVLQKVQSSQPFDEPPQVWRERGLLSKMDACTEVLPLSGFLRRFVEIEIGLLSRSRPVPCAALNQTIFERFNSTCRREPVPAASLVLSDLILDSVDPSWLTSHVPQFKRKIRGALFSRIDIIVWQRRRAATGDSYALALAALFKCPEDALKAVAKSEAEQTPPSQRGPHQPQNDEFFYGDVWPQYLSCQGNLASLASALQMHPGVLRSKMKTAGLPSLRGLLTSPAWDALLRLHEGWSFAQACELENVQPVDLERLIRMSIGRAAGAARIIKRRSA